MLLQELLRHVADNVEAGRLPAFGLEYSGVNISDNISIFAFCFDNPEKYSLAPRTQTVNGFEVPAPESNPLVEGTDYYMPVPSAESWVSTNEFWDGRAHDDLRLARGVIFTTKEAARKNALAMLGFDPGSTKVGDV